MDGFLFGACCQLPSKTLTGGNVEHTVPGTDEIFNVHEIDHVPDIPILLNSDGTPLGMTVSQDTNTVKMDIHHASTQMEKNQGITYTKISTFDAPSTTTKSISGVQAQIQDSVENAEKPQLPAQPDVTHLEEDFPALLGQQNILDDLGLPGLLTHSDSNNNIQNHQNNPVINPVTTLLSPDQILQIADPVDQLPALFSQGLGQNLNHTSPDTILLNENGTMLNETNNPDDLFKPNTVESSVEEKKVTETLSTTQRPRVTESVSYTEIKRPLHDTTHQIGASTTQWIKFSDQSSSSMHEVHASTDDQTLGTSSMTKLPVTQLYANTQRLTTASLPQETAIDNFEKVSTLKERVSIKDVEADEPINKITTTPMTVLPDKKNELVRVPTITYDAPSGNKKDDMIDKEEIAINHIISILNDTKPGTGTTIQTPNSSINKWVSIDETSKPSLVRISTKSPFVPQPTTAESFPYTFYKPGQSSNYYSYETIPTADTSHASYSTSNAYSSRPSTQSVFTSVPTSDYSVKVTTTNPPAPTVIVLGPLGTEFTTETTQKTVVTRKPVAESVGSTTIFRPAIESTRPGPLTTKKPSVSTTITHNISTVISNVATNNVVSTSFFSVNVKDGTTSEPMVEDTSYNTKSTTTQTEAETNSERLSTKRPTIWTTFSTWSNKPSFHPRPSTPPSIVFTDEENVGEAVHTVVFKDPIVSTEMYPRPTTALPHCDEETAAPDDLINFPPVRNPNLNISTPISQQEKPTIVETFNNTGYPDIEILSENDIPTPTFIEDDVLTNKVDTFVNKIMQSLQDNFQVIARSIFHSNGQVIIILL